MTVIVGVQTTRGVILGADSQASCSNGNRKRSDAKLHQRSEILAFGSCGSPRLGDILEYHLPELQEPPLGDAEAMREWMVRDFIDLLRNQARYHGALMDWFGVEYLDNSAFLVAVRGELFTVEEDLQVGAHVLAYDALGSGEEVAIGSLYARFGDQRTPISDIKAAEDAVEQAVAAASEFTNFVGGDIITLETTKLAPDEMELIRSFGGGYAAPQEDAGAPGSKGDDG